MPQPATSSLSRTAVRTEPECSASTRRLRLQAGAKCSTLPSRRVDPFVWRYPSAA